MYFIGVNQSFGWPRQIRKPLIRSGHVILDLCHEEGQLLRHIVARSHGKDIYRDSRETFWGDLWPHGFEKKKDHTRETALDNR